MDEAQHLADRVAVIAHGRVIAEGTADTLGRGAGEAAVVAFRLPATSRCRSCRSRGALLAWAAERGIELEGLTVSRPSLEDVYLQLTEERT
jgi:ABC-2 type transport system ATP-binding protein